MKKRDSEPQADCCPHPAPSFPGPNTCDSAAHGGGYAAPPVSRAEELLAEQLGRKDKELAELRSESMRLFNRAQGLHGELTQALLRIAQWEAYDQLVAFAAAALGNPFLGDGFLSNNPEEAAKAAFDVAMAMQEHSRRHCPPRDSQRAVANR